MTSHPEMKGVEGGSLHHRFYYCAGENQYTVPNFPKVLQGVGEIVRQLDEVYSNLNRLEQGARRLTAEQQAVALRETKRMVERNFNLLQQVYSILDNSFGLGRDQFEED